MQPNVEVSAMKTGENLTIVISKNGNIVKEILSDANGWLNLFNSPQYADFLKG